ncbi:Non-receptor tyrosine kinase [Tieghemostelium lacteum]|uniref:Non-receptor tyrosine kinase n=1 Tax=Tieghemostelium lacteum TaxID=361077 RepID=A0A152A4K3_TIELA|nr:Non-receptor tyrosine kinase [Tieghemostelium lacteum]|eukprot:KYR01166.1 Non-receptor tyrosine kinase [Tieghemostelium lacteum]
MCGQSIFPNIIYIKILDYLIRYSRYIGMYRECMKKITGVCREWDKNIIPKLSHIRLTINRKEKYLNLLNTSINSNNNNNGYNNLLLRSVIDLYLNSETIELHQTRFEFDEYIDLIAMKSFDLQPRLKQLTQLKCITIEVPLVNLNQQLTKLDTIFPKDDKPLLPVNKLELYFQNQNSDPRDVQLMDFEGIFLSTPNLSTLAISGGVNPAKIIDIEYLANDTIFGHLTNLRMNGIHLSCKKFTRLISSAKFLTSLYLADIRYSQNIIDEQYSLFISDGIGKSQSLETVNIFNSYRYRVTLNALIQCINNSKTIHHLNISTTDILLSNFTSKASLNQIQIFNNSLRFLNFNPPVFESDTSFEPEPISLLPYWKCSSQLKTIKIDCLDTLQCQSIRNHLSCKILEFQFQESLAELLSFRLPNLKQLILNSDSKVSKKSQEFVNQLLSFVEIHVGFQLKYLHFTMTINFGNAMTILETISPSIQKIEFQIVSGWDIKKVTQVLCSNTSLYSIGFNTILDPNRESLTEMIEQLMILLSRNHNLNEIVMVGPNVQEKVNQQIVQKFSQCLKENNQYIYSLKLKLFSNSIISDIIKENLIYQF